jgi:hypothetical protein
MLEDVLRLLMKISMRKTRTADTYTTIKIHWTSARRTFASLLTSNSFRNSIKALNDLLVLGNVSYFESCGSNIV